MFFDLSWIHLRPFSADILTGYHQSTICSVNQSKIEVVIKPLASLAEPDFSDFSRTDFHTCYTSSMMIFRSSISHSTSWLHSYDDDPHRKILKCTLQKYSEEDGPLRSCLLIEPEISGGALCVQVFIIKEYAYHTIASFARLL